MDGTELIITRRVSQCIMLRLNVPTINYLGSDSPVQTKPSHLAVLKWVITLLAVVVLTPPPQLPCGLCFSSDLQIPPLFESLPWLPQGSVPEAP